MGSMVSFCRLQPNSVRFTVERLDGGLVVDHGHNDVTVVGCLLLAHDHKVAVHDPDIDHRLASDPQDEGGLVGDLGRKRHRLLDVL